MIDWQGEKRFCTREVSKLILQSVTTKYTVINTLCISAYEIDREREREIEKEVAIKSMQHTTIKRFRYICRFVRFISLTGSCAQMYECVRIRLGKVAHIWLFRTQAHTLLHTHDFLRSCVAPASTNQFNFRWLNSSLDKRIHNSIQHHIRCLVYHRMYTDAFYLSLCFPSRRTSMIYVVFNFRNRCDNTTHCMYGLFFRFVCFFFFFCVRWVRPFGFLVWFESNLQINEPAGKLYK